MMWNRRTDWTQEFSSDEKRWTLRGYEDAVADKERDPNISVRYYRQRFVDWYVKGYEKGLKNL